MTQGLYRWRPHVVVTCAAVVLAALELVAFNRFALREVTWGFPIAFDQCSYGVEAFRLYEEMLKRGIWPVAVQYLSQSSPQGLLLQFQAALLSRALGPGWLQLLNVNFLYFLLLQGATAFAVWHVSGRCWRWVLVALGLTLTVGTPYFWAGGITDFRLDFAAFCLYGMFIAAVMRSGVFASRGWSLVAAIIAGSLVWVRLLTVTYLVGIGLALLLYLLLEMGPGTRRLNAGLWLVAVLGLVIPILVRRAASLYSYYWVGHVSGQEAGIRAREQGLAHLWGHLTFYPVSLIRIHLGPVFLGVACLILLLTLVKRLSARLEPTATRGDEGPSLDAFVFCVLCLVVPLVVLTADVSKSPVVAGITSSAAVWLVILGAMRLGKRDLVKGAVGSLLTVLVFIAGLGYTSWQLVHHLPLWDQRSEVRGLVDAYDQIAAAALPLARSKPVGLSSFAVLEHMHACVVNFLAYERHRYVLNIHQELGDTIFATNAADAIEKLNESSFVILTEGRPKSELVYPFDRTLRPLIPMLRAYVRERFIYMTYFTFKGSRYEVYRRPAAPLPDSRTAG